MYIKHDEAELFLSQIPGIGIKAYQKILKSDVNLIDFIDNALKDNVLLKKVLTPYALQNIKDYYESNEFFKLKQNLSKYNVNHIPLNHEQYSNFLKSIYDPPKVLFYKGNIELLNSINTVAVIGTRNCTNYGKKAVDDIVTGLSSLGYIIVSGMAFGIDSCAHEAALNANGNTIAVLAGGVEKASPYSNDPIYRRILSSGGLIVSEYPPDYAIVPGLFPRRSRIISGLCKGVVVVEAGERSGSLIAARMALEQNREVFAVPSGIYSSSGKGSNNLIKCGEAKLIQTADDIVDEMNLNAKNSMTSEIEYTPLEKSILDVVSNQSMTVDEIVRSVNLSISDALSLLSVMEIENKINKNDQGQYFL